MVILNPFLASYGMFGCLVAPISSQINAQEEEDYFKNWLPSANLKHTNSDKGGFFYIKNKFYYGISRIHFCMMFSIVVVV